MHKQLKIILFLFLLAGCITMPVPLHSHSRTEGPDLSVEDARFRSVAKDYKISHRSVSGLKGIANGYYLIAGVFGEAQNASRLARSLKRKGLMANTLVNPRNQMHYVFVGHTTKGLEALHHYQKNIKPKYQDKIWILNVQNTASTPVTIRKKQARAITQPKTHSISFSEMAKASKIPTRSIESSPEIAPGYYLIGGVFGETTNAKRFSSKLKTRFSTAGRLQHPETGLYHVYLDRLQEGEAAIAAYNSQYEGRYTDKLWILEVIPPPAIEMEEGAQLSDVLSEEALPLENSYNRNKQFSLPVNDKLLQKADQYFDKMWYAEAAEIYESVLARGGTNPDYRIIQRAADSHYFNTNMERAFYWYDMLYRNYRKEMSADNLFKYAHTLKGTGKYARSKRLMRLYERKMRKGNNDGLEDMNKPIPSEVILDNIRNTAGEFEVKNIGVNSPYSDFAPMFHGEDQLVFASSADSAFFKTRRYKWNNQPYLDLYVAKINKENQEVKNAAKFSKKINTKYHEATVAFSPDNTTMYFTRNNYGKKLKRDKKGVNHLKIYKSTKVNGEWTEAQELPFNSDNYSTGHPALSPDGKQLYFVSDMPGSLGKTDIFVVDVLEDGSFSEPRNLGPEINTERREMFPYITDKKLYFSSDGHVGLGGLDVFEVPYNDEDGFLEVRNVGQPINSKVDDFSFIVDEASQKGFFASNRRGGKGDDDIYSFQKPIPEEANENAIAGVITERVSGERMPGALVELLDENNRKLKEMLSDEDGSFIFEDLDSNTKYVIRTVKDSYEDHELAISTLENERVETAIEMDKLKQLITIEDGIRKLKVDMIYFDFDKSYIRKDAAASLDKLVATMKEHPNMVIKIESHTDSRGPAVYNKYLSDKRAKSTRAYLIEQGIDPKRIQSAIGYGEERLLNECDGTVRCSREQHQLNRRSEFIIVSM